ncbi:MAG: hypothetical protein U9O65_00460 [Thermotogota bacterium]|nr:hypothetical protein [Thermotogota bacterium]
MELWEALNLKNSGLISAVGGGGKTVLSFSLARELKAQGNNFWDKLVYPGKSSTFRGR